MTLNPDQISLKRPLAWLNLSRSETLGSRNIWSNLWKSDVLLLLRSFLAYDIRPNFFSFFKFLPFQDLEHSNSILLVLLLLASFLCAELALTLLVFFCQLPWIVTSYNLNIISINQFRYWANWCVVNFQNWHHATADQYISPCSPDSETYSIWTKVNFCLEISWNIFNSKRK